MPPKSPSSKILSPDILSFALPSAGAETPGGAVATVSAVTAVVVPVATQRAAATRARERGIFTGNCLAPGPESPAPAYFTAPAVRLRTSCFWKMSNRMTRGMNPSTAPAKAVGI